MESIRININKQLGHDGLVPVITLPAEAAYDFRLRSCRDDMEHISTNRAYRLIIYPDGENLQVSLIDSIDGGYIEYGVLLNIHQKSISGETLLEALDDLSSAYKALPPSERKPSENKAFRNAVAAVHRTLSESTGPGYPEPLKVAKKSDESQLTYYMNYRTKGEISTLLLYPDQEFFGTTSVLYLIGDDVTPAQPRFCKHVHSLVLRTFKIKSPQGYEYGQVKEGETVRISLKGKEGMLPMTTDVVGDVRKPSPYGYYDSTTSTIRIDERTIKFFYELKFIVKHNGRHYRGCIVRYNGEQVMPDSNGCYLVKVYEDMVNNAGYIQFSGEGFKDARIQVTPGIVKQQEYIFNPEPQHDVTNVTLDFGDGHPIDVSIDVGTNDRLYNQLRSGKVKGYNVKQEGDSYRMFIPRKLTAASKNTLRLLKFLTMIAFTLAAYAGVTWLATQHWPWPIEQILTTEENPALKSRVDATGEITTVEEENDEDVGLIVDESDQVSLENQDQAYLQANNVWRRDSIKSNKYKDIINTIFNGRISEIKIKGYNTKVINNVWWEQIWRNIVVPNNIHKANATEVFQSIIADHNTLDVEKLYEELSKRLMATGDMVQPSTSPAYNKPRSNSTPVVPSEPLP